MLGLPVSTKETQKKKIFFLFASDILGSVYMFIKKNSEKVLLKLFLKIVKIL